ncbi:Uncharacterised protein [Sphingobacterium multivorum]|uniref:YD repeat-containing protein n=2 Tax=Sphingobacterium multivorum TaxID=28454 RepID=A0A2X2J9F1_SPHMU|nr:hypothetical protein [Sphingobacterium multivorum]SPZ88343.1 Uncharacterised protein [Sphingobacterium multivorum]
MPVSLFTGLPNVEIPIYNLHEGELNVPVKLSYHASGFRSDLKPGIIAPNWSLQSSGVIQRKVKDRADDMNYYGYDGIPNLGISKYEAERYNYSGFYFNRDTLKTMMGTRWGQISFLNDLAFPLSSSNPLTNTLLGYRDTEPDEFSFSLPTGGGSFYLDIDGNWVVAADKNFKVELNSTFLEVPFKLPVTSKDKDGYSFSGAFGNNWRAQYGSYKTFGGFTIIDEDGTKYVFGGSSNYIEYSIDFVNQDRDFWQADAWHLKQVIHPNGEIIDFKYTRGAFTAQLSEYKYWNIQTKYSNTNTSIFNFLGAISCGGNSQSLQSTFTGRLNAPIYLSEIISSSKRITFQYENNPTKIAATWVNQGILQAVNPFTNMHNFYFQSLSYPSVRLNEENDSANFPYYYNTLALPYLIQYYNNLSSSYGSAGTIPYNFRSADFSYFYSSFLEDLRLSKIDIFNNVNSGVNADGTLTVLPSDALSDISKIQHIDLNYTTSTASSNRYNLTGVVFSDGNSSKISSYAMDYNALDGNCYFFNGRTDHWGFYNSNAIYSVETNDLKNNPAKYYNARNPSLMHTKMNMLKSITYPTGGRAELDYELNDAYFSVPKNRTDSLNLWNKSVGGLRIKKLSFYPEIGSPIVKTYHYVTNYNTTGQQRSSGVLSHEIQYNFQDFKTKAAQGDVYVTKTIFSNNSVIPAASSSQGSHIGYSEVVEENSDGSYIKHYFTNFDNGHKDESGLSVIADLSPYNPYTSKEAERGKEYKTEIYDNSKRLVKKVETTFINLNPAQNISKAIYVERNKLCAGEWYESTAKYYVNYTYSVLPSKEKVTEYVYNGSSSTTAVNTTEYSYYEHRKPKEITRNDSKGNILKTEYRYSIDMASSGYSDTFGQAINTLAQKNILVPIEKINYKNGSPISAEIYEYKSYAGLNNPAQISKEFQWNKFLSASYQKLYKSGTTLTKAGNIDELARIESYNKYGKPTEILFKQADRISYVWGFYKDRPIAVVKNADYATIKSQFGANIDLAERYFLTESKINDLENSIRSYFNKTDIYFYNSNSLGLLSKIGSPQEINVFYAYDNAQRLKTVYDANRDIVKRYDYGFADINYIPQAEPGAIVYAKLVYENWNPGAGNNYADVIVKFFSDEACTRPIRVENMTVNYNINFGCANIPGLPVGEPIAEPVDGMYGGDTYGSGGLIDGGEVPEPVPPGPVPAGYYRTAVASGTSVVLAYQAKIYGSYESDCEWIYEPPTFCPECGPGEVPGPNYPGGTWVQICLVEQCADNYFLQPGTNYRITFY